MSEETPDKQSSASGWVTGVIAALTLYILAPGPVLLLIGKGVIKRDSIVFSVYQIGWFPMSKLYDHSESVRVFYRVYFKVLGTSLD